MACTVAHESGRTTIHLVGDLDDRDFDEIENGFELALGRRDPAVVFDFTGLSRITSSIRALLGVLRLQAHHYGTTIELRNLAPEFSAALAEPRAMASMAMDG